MNLNPTIAQALRPWMPPQDDPREHLLLEEDDDLDPDEPDADPVMEKNYCPACNGSGEGSYDGSSCRTCGGSGETWQERSE